MPVIWQPEMSVGNTIIDDEHKYLICLINSVELALKLGDEGKMLKLIFDQLLAYTHEHFAREEKIQIKMKYLHYATHKLEHQDILTNLEALRTRILEGLSNQPAAQENTQKDPQKKPAPVAAEANQALVEDGLYVQNLEDADEIDFEAAEREVAPPPASDAVSPQLPTDEIVKLLRHWILDHVLKSDMQMKRYLQRFPSNFA